MRAHTHVYQLPALALAIAVAFVTSAARAAPTDCIAQGGLMECASGVQTGGDQHYICTNGIAAFAACGASAPNGGPFGSEGATTSAYTCAQDAMTGCPGSTADAVVWNGVGTMISAPGCGPAWNSVRVHTVGGIQADGFGQFGIHYFSKSGNVCNVPGSGLPWIIRLRNVSCPATYLSLPIDNYGSVDCRRCPSGYAWNGSQCVTTAACTSGGGNSYLGTCFGSVVAPKNAGKGCANGDCMVGDPFDPTFSGVHTVIEPILVTPTFSHFLAYNSRPTGAYAPPRPNPFGAQWTSPLTTSLLTKVSGYAIGAVRPRGNVQSFTAPVSGTLFVADRDVVDTLEKIVDAGGATTGYRYTEAASDTVETYDAAGRLLARTDLQGNATTFAYSTASTPAAIAPAPGLLITVTDWVGRAISLTYDAQSRVVAMTNPANGVTTFKYDEASGNGTANNLTSVTFPDGSKRTYFYNEGAQTSGAALPTTLTGIADESGARIETFKYDSGGRSLSSQSPGGASLTSAVYNSSGTVSVTDALGTTRVYTSQLVNGVYKVTSIAGAACPTCGPKAQTFDVNGFVTAKTDWNGVTTTFAHGDARKELETSRVEAAGTPLARTIATSWHPTFRAPVQVTEPGRTTSFTYDGSGNVLSRTVRDAASGATRTVTFTYDARGRVLSEDGPRTDVADVTTYAYYPDDDADVGRRGNLATVTNALGHVAKVTSYDALGQPLTIVDPNGTTRQLTYDTRQRVTSRTVGGLTTSMQYTPYGELASLHLSDGRVLDIGRDAASRVTSVADAAGNRFVYTLNAMGLRTQEALTNAALATLEQRSFVYDAAGALTQRIGGAGQTTTFAYDGNGNVTQRTDPLGHATAYAYDALGRLTKVTMPDATTVTLGYDALDRVTSVKDARGLVTTTTYDAFGQTISTTSPDAGTVTFTYDAAGNLKTRKDALGQTTSFTYDALGRRLSATYDDGTQTKYVYDEGTNGIGRLTTQIDASGGGRSYVYDGLGRVTVMTTSFPSALATLALSVTYAYDASGRLQSMGYPSGRTVTYAYDALANVSKVQTSSSGAVTTLADNVTYRPFGPLTGLTTQGGAVLSRTFDGDGRIANYTAGGSSWNVAYDLASRITSITNAGNPADTRTFAYDAVDRLIAATTPAGSESFTYDAAGNRLSRTSGASSTVYTYGATNNRVLAASGATPRSFTYDANGSPVSDGINTFVYDARGRMSQVTSGSSGTVRYFVDGDGRRFAKSSTR